MRKWVWVVVALLLIAPAVAAEGDVAKHKLLILDSPYAIIEDWTNLTYTQERFGLGQFEVTLPIDHNQAAALVEYNRVLIVRGDDDWDNQAKRLWGIILNVKKHYAEDAGPDTGESGIGAAFVTATGVTFTEYFLSSRVYPLPDAVTLLPDGDGIFSGYWSGTTGTYADVDEGVDNHDGNTTYIDGQEIGDIALVTLENYVDPGTVIAGVRIRSVWKVPIAGVSTPHVVVRIPDHSHLERSPTSNGTDTDWTGAWTDVDDDPDSPDDDSTYISSSTADHESSFPVGEPGLPKDAVFAELGIAYRARCTTADYVWVRPYLIIDGTRYYGTGTMAGLDTSYNDYSDRWPANPATDESWTVSDLDDVEVGIEVKQCDGGEARVTLIYLDAYYVFQYALDQVEGSWVERYVDLAKNPGTLTTWTESDLDSLQIGVRCETNRWVYVTAIEALVYHKAIQTTGNLDDVLKAWVNANLGSGAAVGRLVTGFTEEADESAAGSGTWEIAYNVLLQRFLALCKVNDVGMDIVGAWAAGATRLDAAASYEFQTSYPEGTDRTHTQSVNDPVIISRGRGLSRLLNYELDAVTARNVAYALGEKDGLEQIKQTTEGGAARLAKEDGGLLLKEDSWPILLEGIPAFLRRECVLDVENADTTTQLTAEGTKFLNDEAAELEMVSYGHQSGQDMYVPLTDFNPGDLITYYDDKLSIGPLTPVVESISCSVPSDGVEQYEVALGAVKRAALSEDAAFRATGKRKTLFVKQ